MKSNTLTIRKMTFCAIFTALIAVGAFIKIPVPPIPFTLQTMFVVLAGLMLGGNMGCISALLYMILGIIGIPIFTGGGGICYVLKPTFGYIIGFCVGAYAIGKISYKNGKLGGYARMFCGVLAGLGIIYGFGIIYYYFITNFVTSSYPGFWFMILHCFLMTIPGDLITCALACLLAKRVHPVTGRYIYKNA